MATKKESVKEIRNHILSYECNYDYLYARLQDNFEFTISGILNAMLYLFKNCDNSYNKMAMDDLISLLNNFIKNNKNKKIMEKLYDKIQVFLENIGKSLDYLKLKQIEKYISAMIELQNRCLSNYIKKNKSDKYNFIMYLIFESRDVELLHKYMLDNMKELLKSNSLLPSIFIEIIEKFTKLDPDNEIEIKYYNQVLNLFLRGSLYNKLFKIKNNEFMQILKSSDKEFVWKLIDKIENGFSTKEEIAKEYSVSFIFPKDLEEIKYTSNGLVDFTHQNIITIDGENDTCLDDAIYIERNNNGTYTLYIHLANPPSIIPYYSKTMKEALKRGETIYLADDEISIFDNYLANGLLSILPNKRTNTFTFIVTLDTDFTFLLDTTRVVPGVVINRNKLSYEKVDSILERNVPSPIYSDLLLLSKATDMLSKDNLQIRALHKLENIVTGNKSNNSSKSDYLASHKIVENSMIFVNRLPYFLSQYYHLDLPLIYRVKPECDDDFIISVLKGIANIDPSNEHFRKVVRNYIANSRYSTKDIHHDELNINGYVRISSSARRALDALNIYILYSLYINRDEKDLDARYYFWENEANYWCDFVNNRISENNNFLDEYNYRLAKEKILERK